MPNQPTTACSGSGLFAQALRRLHGPIAQVRLGIALFASLVITVACTRYHGDPGWVSSEFVDSFVSADLERAKSVSVPAQWDRIETWMAERQKFKCRGADLMEQSGWGVGREVSDREWVYTELYVCPSQKTPYCLAINDIRVLETEDGWKVTDWETICQMNDVSYECDKMCR